MCRRSAQQSKLCGHQLHARHLDAPISCGSRCEREMVQICAVPPSRFQRADFKACLIVFRPFREKLLRKQLGIHSGVYGEHEAEKSPHQGLYSHNTCSEVSEELTDRKKRQVSSDFQSSFEKVKRNRSEFIIFWLYLSRDALTEYEMEAKRGKSKRREHQVLTH